MPPRSKVSVVLIAIALALAIALLLAQARAIVGEETSPLCRAECLGVMIHRGAIASVEVPATAG